MERINPRVSGNACPRRKRHRFSIDPEGFDIDRSIYFPDSRLIFKIHNSSSRCDTSTFAFTRAINKIGKDNVEYVYIYITCISSVSMAKQLTKSTEQQSRRFIPSIRSLFSRRDKFIRVNTINYPFLLPFFFFRRFQKPCLVSPRLLPRLNRGKRFMDGISLDRR